MLRTRILPTFVVKTKDCQLLKIVWQWKIETKGYNGIEIIVREINWKELSEVHYDYTFQKCMNSYIYIKVTACNNIFVVMAYSLKVFLSKFRGQRVNMLRLSGYRYF